MIDPILVLDDEAAYAEMLKELLEKEGYTAEMETNPRRAITRLRERGFSLIVCDFKMPEVDGAEFLQEVRKVSPKAPVIMVSGMMTTPDLLKVANIGVTLVLEKPFNPVQFFEHVRRLTQAEVSTEAGETIEQIPLVAEELPFSIQSDPAKELLRTAREALNRGFRQLVVPMPAGSEWGEWAKSIAALVDGEHKGAVSHVCLMDLEVPDAEAMLGSLAAAQGVSKVVAIGGPDHRPFDRERFNAVLNRLTGLQSNLAKFVFLHAVPSGFGNEAEETRSFPENAVLLSALPPLCERPVDLAWYVNRYLQEFSEEARPQLTPGAARFLLHHCWTENHRELMAVIRRAFLTAVGKTVSRATLEKVIRSRHAIIEHPAEHLDLETYLVQHQRRFFLQYCGPEADIPAMAEASRIEADRFLPGRSVQAQPLLFPELLVDRDDTPSE